VFWCWFRRARVVDLVVWCRDEMVLWWWGVEMLTCWIWRCQCAVDVVRA
jgi:hypothetical protein